jgi:hypothetical protein
MLDADIDAATVEFESLPADGRAAELVRAGSDADEVPGPRA